MKRSRALLLVGGVLSLAMAGCNVQSSLPVGQNVIIQFRRDALGAGASLPVPPTTQEWNGASVYLYGMLRGADAEWLTLEREGKTYWIPRINVLLIEAQI
ncbi:MAG: hypothetical protein KY468_18830, partial [Armatimonadetes bacterium]|nr:hypothetical protein [Armatimonadota bacterium]